MTMAESVVVSAETPPEEVPLLVSDQSREQQSQHPDEQWDRGGEGDGDGDDCDLEGELRNLETVLRFYGFCQSSVASFVFSWLAFLLIGVALPVTVLELSDCEDCEEYQYKAFEMYIVVSQACLAAVSLICVSRNLRKRGIRKFLFVDRDKGHIPRLKDQYVKQIRDCLKLLLSWSLPCLVMKTIREIIRALFITREPWWLSIAILLALILSWTYVSTITLLASAMFHLVCNLQVIHFDDYKKLVESGTDIYTLINEHIQLRYHLSKISHRFRVFLVLQSLFVTASQVVTLFQTTGYTERITFINGGDFAVSSIVQVAGIIISLHAATRISHKAQSTTSHISTWHALATCTPGDASLMRLSTSVGGASPKSMVRMSYSESDLESMGYAMAPTSSYLAACMTSYQKRQAYVTYLQMNPGGITIYGWTVDRVFINTIFCIELTLVTFVLGKTIVLGSSI